MLSELLKVQLNSDLIRLICFINYLIVLSSLKQKTISGVLWSCVERFSVQGIQFVIMVIILLPSDYGMIGMLAIFAARARGIKDIVLTGNLAQVPQAEMTFGVLNNMFSMNFLMPENRQYATVIGTALKQFDDRGGVCGV